MEEPLSQVDHHLSCQRQDPIIYCRRHLHKVDKSSRLTKGNDKAPYIQVMAHVPQFIVYIDLPLGFKSKHVVEAQLSCYDALC